MSAHTDTIRRLIAAIDAEDWQAVWDLHDDDALLIVGPQILPRRAIPPLNYVQVLASIADATRHLAPARFRLVSAEADDSSQGPLVMARLHDETADRAFVAGFRLAPSGGILSTVVAPASRVSLDAEAAADLVQLPRPTERHEGYLTPLHHSYCRRLQGVQRPIRVLPEARFTCQGRGDCCKVGHWSVSVSDNQRLPLDRLTVATGGTRLQVVTPAGEPVYADPEATVERHTFAVGEPPGCHQLDRRGRCQIHHALGWQPIPVCQLYPLSPIPTPDGFDVVLHFGCETVCRHQGERLADQMPELRRRLWPYQYRLESVPDVIARHAGDAPGLAWAEYRQWEGELLDRLAGFTEQGPRVLVDGSRRLAAWLGDSRAQGVGVAELFGSLLRPEVPADWGEGWMGGGYRRAFEVSVGRALLPRGADGLTRYLRAVLFRKAGLVGGRAGAGFAWGLTVLAYRMVEADAVFRAVRQGRTVVHEDDLVAAVRAVDALVGQERLTRWLSGLPGAPLEAPATWQALLSGV